MRNPFSYGDLALDEAFTDREAELRELKSDMLNGQNVVVFAPRRFGKSSLVWRAIQEVAAEDGVLVAQVDLMTTTTKEQLAAKLAASVYEQIATPLLRARDKAAQVFRGLRIRPLMTIEPSDGSLGFSFTAGHSREDVDATLERLFQLPAELAAERGERAALVFDEFQEVLAIDPHLPSLMRATFQSQPDVARVYLGSKRSLIENLFNDANEPFWRSAKQMELGRIPIDAFAAFIRARFESTNRLVPDEIVDKVLGVTRGHPYATQELCYALWEEVPEGEAADADAFDRAMLQVLRSENAHFTSVWEAASRIQRQALQALAREPLSSITSQEYRRRHGLPAAASVQKALDTLVDDELIEKIQPGDYEISEPFLREWVLRYGT
jgi:AAA+ ATPase superfamily predicted ATPase